MENTNKMKNLTNDLKAFEQMMKEQRKENSYPEIEFEIDTEEDSPAPSSSSFGAVSGAST